MSKTTEKPTADERYSQWKSLVPVLYDWLAHHNLIWPSLSCRWGPRLEQGTYKNRQRLYLSEQTDGSSPNTLVVANCEIVKPRVAAAEHICQFNEEARSPFVKRVKTIIHPGEVNRIREIPQNTNIIATHTDSPDVYVWDVVEQPNRQFARGASASKPDLILSGHKENAEFALAACPLEPYIASGGKDKLVVVWSIQDYTSSLAATPELLDSPGSHTKSAPKFFESGSKPSVAPRGIFQGHTDNVEDVQFSPSSSHELCSVGDDRCLILWDSRTSEASVKVDKAHDADLHSVDWNQHNTNLILTGSADNCVHLFDRRKMKADGIGCPVNKFKGHKAAVLCVQWSPQKSSVFGSSAEDGLLNIWDFEKVGKKAESLSELKLPNGPSELLFRHAGHRDRVVDFHWNGDDPWTIASVSDDCVTCGGGGTLQIWRMLDLIYRPKEEVITEFDTYQLSF